MNSVWSAILVVIGMVLLALSFVWGFIFPASQTWTDEKASRMTELSNQGRLLLIEANNAKYKPKPGGPSPKEALEKYDAVKAELNKLKEEFMGARDSPKTISSYLLWSGAGFILVGGMAVMASGRGD